MCGSWFFISLFSILAEAQTSPASQWPFEAGASARIMNTISSFQTYGHKAGFHHGLDLAVAAGTNAYAPVSGKLSARYYYPPHPSDYTFELSITEHDGSRWELHHIDKSTIPADLLAKAERQESIAAGTYLGKIFDASVYDLEPHLHINLIKNGLYHEPLLALPRPLDQTAPVIADIYYVTNGRAKKMEDLNFQDLDENAVLAIEMYDPSENGKRLPVHSFEISDEGGKKLYSFDFSKLPYEDFLQGPDETYHVSAFQLPTGETKRTDSEVFFYRVPMKNLFDAGLLQNGYVTMKARDLSGLSAEKRLRADR